MISIILGKFGIIIERMIFAVKIQKIADSIDLKTTIVLSTGYEQK
jgi:hypothetical protein